jgi:hypothetical protein
MDWGMFAAIVGVIGIQTALLLWMMSKLDADIRATTAESNAKWTAASAESNAKWMAVNARIDQTQSIIMRMLEKQGK